MGKWSGTTESSSGEKLVKPVVICPPFIPSRGRDQVVLIGREERPRQSQAGHEFQRPQKYATFPDLRSHAKVSWFPLADWLAERKRALRTYR
jgi:hypothetical protein